MTERKAWMAFYKSHAILNTCADTAKKCFETLTPEQRESYYDFYEGREGIEIRKVMIRPVSFFNAERKSSDRTRR